MRLLRKFCALAAIALATIGNGFAQAPAPAPARVEIGVVLNRVEQFSLKENRYLINFYVWFRWSDDAIKPFETMEIVNGHIESKDLSDAHDLPGGHYACYLVRATIDQNFDLSRYPLERHQLTVEIEDAAEDARVQYVADTANSALGDSFRVPGFKPRDASFKVVQHLYRTNYGDLSLPTGSESTYSRFIASVEVERPGNQFAVKLFISLYIATFIALLAMFVSPELLDARLGLGVAAVFAAVGSQFVMSANLPETDQVTVADKAALLSIVFVFLTMAETILAFAIARRGREAVALRIDRIGFVALLGAYALANWMIGR